MRSDPQAYGAHISGADVSRLCHSGAYYVEALSRRGPVLRAFAAEVFAKVDVLVTPTIRTCLPTLAETDIDHGPPGTENEVHGGVGQHAAVQLSRLAGDQRALRLRSERLPIGLQIAGRPFAEARMLKVADAYQRDTDFHAPSAHLALLKD